MLLWALLLPLSAVIIAADIATPKAAPSAGNSYLKHQTKEGRQCHFGMKLRTRGDSQSGLVHRATAMAAKVYDKHVLPHLVHGNEKRVYGGNAYASQKELIHRKAPCARNFTNERVRRRRDRSSTRPSARGAATSRKFGLKLRDGGLFNVALDRLTKCLWGRCAALPY